MKKAAFSIALPFTLSFLFVFPLFSAIRALKGLLSWLRDMLMVGLEPFPDRCDIVVVDEPGDDKQRGKIQGKLQGVIEMEVQCVKGGFQEIKYSKLKQIDFGSDGSQPD